MSIYETIAIIIAALNVLAFVLLGIDKRMSRNGGCRIPDAILLVIAGFGGGLGAQTGMLFFHTKTHHRLYTTLVPAFITIHLLIIMVIMFRLMF